MKTSNVTSCILRFTCEKNCSDHGVCVAPDQCRCEEGYTGPDCSEVTCEKNCSYHGVCVAPDQCRCEEGYIGPDCSEVTCEKNCSYHGVCIAQDQCRCEEGYTGPDCSEATCEKNCSDHAICVAPDQCRCEERYTGPDCSENSTVNTNPGNAKNVAAIVGGSVGGLIFLFLIILLVARVSRARKRAAVHNEKITENDHDKLVENATVDNAEIQRGVYNNPTFAYGSLC